MFAVARIAPGLGCALMMLIGAGVMVCVAATRWARRRFSSVRNVHRPGDVAGLREEIASLAAALDERDRSGTLS